MYWFSGLLSRATWTPQKRFFAIAEPEPFPVVLVATVSGASAVIISLSLLAYFKKSNY
jgi:hypothetical protein